MHNNKNKQPHESLSLSLITLKINQENISTKLNNKIK